MFKKTKKYYNTIMKSLKLFTVLSSVVAIGGTSAFAILTTSCGGDKVKDFGT
jgi:hypothetical protein